MKAALPNVETEHTLQLSCKTKGRTLAPLRNTIIKGKPIKIVSFSEIFSKIIKK